MSSYQRTVFVAAAAAVCAFVHVDRIVHAAAPEPGTTTAELRGFLEAQGSPSFAADDRGAELWKVLQAFYQARAYEPAWVRGGRLTPGAQALLRAIASAGREGLLATRYDPRTFTGAHAVTAAMGAPDAGDQARLDVALSYAFLRYASDLGAGSVDPRGAASLWRVSARDFDAAAALDEAVDDDKPVEVLAGLRPPHPQYEALAAALVRYLRIAGEGGWPAVPAAGKKPAARAAQPAALAARLRASGDVTLRAFQRRHGLAATGKLDRGTLAALNVPVEDRIRQIELNLERWRWQGWERKGRRILVNVPTFELHAYDDGREALTMRVITGSGDNQTPIFDEQVTQVVFSPHWNVPANILETEVLPAIKRDPGYLKRKNMDMVRTASGVSVRQRPGPSNALGLVKFLFPNPFNIYLHDTPGDALFARPRRTLSHGCVRLEKPEELARFVLDGEDDWDDDKAIARAMRSGRERFVTVEDPVPLRIAYFTTWVDADGTVRFAPDVYRHDVAQGGLLPARPAPPAATIAASR
jgi:murein L,D-transpeptidase YcbB/YkuD